MIKCYFGVPGCGKSTILTSEAVKGLRLRSVFGRFGRKRYDNVYTSFSVKGCKKIDYMVLDKYKIYNSLIILDELTLDADNRSFKSFPEGVRDFIILHRHLGNDIVYATQSYELVDKKIRVLTDELWYMCKSVVPLFRQFSAAKRIYRTININEHTSELTLGYRFCNLIESFFVSNLRLVFRPRYYRYFNSYDEDKLQTRPVYQGESWTEDKEHFTFRKLLQKLNKNEEKNEK